jgi:hypothetical protein
MAGQCNNVKCTGHVADEACRPFSIPRRIVVVVGWVQAINADYIGVAGDLLLGGWAGCGKNR